jgi:D-glycero-alpha-D-manno-heptose-7-phosphate kinase
MIISRTPFRISFFGGGTDYPAWYRKNGGAVLASSIDKYCYLTCRYLPPFFENNFRVVWSKTENCLTIDEIEHPAVRGILRYLNWDRGVEIHHVGDLPARSGIGSSSSFSVGLLHALWGLQGHMPSKHQLATESIYVEQEVLKETVGSQDQVSAAYGGFNHIVFLPNGDLSVRPLTLKQSRIQELNDHLMLFYTGITRTASDIADTYVQDIQRNAPQLNLMSGMVDEGISILSGDEDIARFGELLHEAWLLKRSLSSKVSNSRVDEIYEQALSAGAIGGKLTGAGGGGFMLLLVPPSRQREIKERFNMLLQVPFRFESSGSQIIFFDPEQDYSAVERARADQPIQAFQELGPS